MSESVFTSKSKDPAATYGSSILEAQNIWPDRPVGCLISIGTGLEAPLQVPDKPEKVPQLITSILKRTSPRLLHQLAVVEYCVQCLTSCELVHREIAEHPEMAAL